MGYSQSSNQGEDFSEEKLKAVKELGKGGVDTGEKSSEKGNFSQISHKSVEDVNNSL